VVFLGGSSLVPSVSAFKKWVYVHLNNWLLLSAFQMSDQNMEQWVEQVRSFKARIMYCYASSAYLFARFLKERGIRDIRFRAVFTTAEVLQPRYRETIEQVFSAEVFDTYGGVDGAGYAFECERHQGLHIVSENSVVEILSDDGEPVEDGEAGEIITTDLTNYAMPFIRYQKGDIATRTERPCDCGRGLPLIKDIQGRVGDFLVNRQGLRVHEQFFAHLFRGVGGLRQYYVEQESQEEIQVFIKLEPGHFGETHLNRVTRIIEDKFPGMRIDVRLTEAIPVRPSGKFRCVVNKLNG
jgi:phenylacetate-CoA ligase